ncbi:MAG: saccharopine dehydrogenase [Candidatus Hydrogenedentota bacterium]|nr:MAG: saccharopine dehydrogenase [Candidatus Hydrogenedentota bacterium]
MKKQFLIYGANGFTGRLITEQAVKEGLKPVLAGRNEQAISELAQQYNLEHKIFSLNEVESVAKELANFSFVIHCAGPFVNTAEMMMEACILSETHYTDITGEIPVFQLAKKKDSAALAANIMLMPGVGFDIVPTDCTALIAKEALPDANKIRIAFVGLAKTSIGTTKSALGQLPNGSLIRENGELKRIPHFSKTWHTKILGKDYDLVAIPWGDVYTAYYTTGVDNIEVYTALPKEQILAGKLLRPFLGLLRNQTILEFAQKQIERHAQNPTVEDMQKGYSYVLGEASNASGQRVRKMIRTKEGYSFTAHSAVQVAKKILDDEWKSGFKTPASVYGSQFVFEIEGTQEME